MIKVSTLAISALSLSFVFQSCNNGSEGDADAQMPAVNNVAPVSNGELKMAYVNTDTLFDKSLMLKALEEEFVAEKLMMENQFKTQYQKLEKDYQDAEAGASQLSQEALQILGQKLQQREQELMMQKQSMEQQLMQSEQDKNDAFYKETRDFVDQFAKANGYHIVYGYNGFGNVLYMDSQFDITAQVVAELNEKYEAEQNASAENDVN